MKKYLIFALAALATTVACSRHALVDSGLGVKDNGQVPIGFTVEKQNITRATNLEAVKHYNFGVWAWKVEATANADGLVDAEVMNNYLVGWSNGSNKGYDKTGATTWASGAGTTADHTSPWFYEGLGTAEYTYTGTAGYYKSSDADYMSNNANQYLRYWDLAYAKTNFYCYAPYNKNVTFSHEGSNTTTSVMTFPGTAIRDGYDEPQNPDYDSYSRTLGEYMYAGVQATNSDKADVTIPFKHMGAQLFIRFYEDIPGYKVEIIDLIDDIKDASTDRNKNGIQATPAIAPSSGTTYSNGTYYITQGATVSFNEADATVATYTPAWTGSTTKTNTTPLMFKIPQAGLTTAADAPANLTDFTGLNSTTYKVIKENVTTGTQEYSYSPTIYYPVAQPTSEPEYTSTGLTFHVSYRIIAEDNKEVITVHNATVFVPAKGSATVGGAAATDQYITVWQPNVKYTYTFKITKGSTGTTDPAGTIDPTDPTPSTTKSLYPIVFDAATIDDYTENVSEYVISNGTSY